MAKPWMMSFQALWLSTLADGVGLLSSGLPVDLALMSLLLFPESTSLYPGTEPCVILVEPFA